ncbi:Alpha/Beta hydrolase protein [Daedaleopsis nitida]|nr:Alpha/Beta hydrolase protein [Daedaleopsis nitida]
MAYDHLAAPDPELARILADSAYVTREHNVCVEICFVRVRIYLPAASEGETFPLLFWVHGGGWVFGTLEQDDYTLKIITVELRMAIVSVDYKLAPETPFPGGLHDCFAALKWAAENPGTLGADLQKGFVVGEQSAGSNYAAVLAQLAKANLALSIPLLCHPEAYPDEYKAKMTSLGPNADAPLLALLATSGKLQALPENPELSPLLHDSLDGLPPAYVQVCGLDPAGDEGLVYAERLDGVLTVDRCYMS